MDRRGSRGTNRQIGPDRFEVDPKIRSISARSCINSIGYGCGVTVHETSFQDDKGNPLKADDFVKGTNVKVVLATPVNIRSKTEARSLGDLVASTFRKLGLPDGRAAYADSMHQY